MELKLDPYPVGWYPFCFSKELKKGEVRTEKYFGKEMVAFRGKDGEVKVVDAFCPHLGAHLGKGGTVVKNQLRCPFHGWEFSGEGVCTKIPFAKTPSKKARLKTYPVKEANSLIHFYYGPDNENPIYPAPENSDLDSKTYKLVHTYERNIKSHPQELRENALDTAHLFCVHHQTVIKDSPFLPFIDDWKEIESEGRLNFKFNTKTNLFGKVMDTPFEFSMYGLGHNYVRIEKPVPMYLTFLNTPIDEKNIKYWHCVWMKKNKIPGYPYLMGKHVAKKVDMEIEQDIPIWENKVYFEKPLLSEVDGPIIKFRTWCQKFYWKLEKRDLVSLPNKEARPNSFISQ